MGYGFQGVCYPDSNEAFAAWVSYYPTAPDAAGYFWQWDGGSVSSWGVVNGAISNGNVGQVPVLFTFADCTYSVSVFDSVTFAAFWMTAMLFVIGCWLFAKNAGVILSAIRRF